MDMVGGMMGNLSSPYPTSDLLLINKIVAM